MKKITKKMLQEKHACPFQVKRFARAFPRGATVTLKNTLRARELGLSLTWAVNILMSLRQQRIYWTKRKNAITGPDREYTKRLAEAFVKAWVLGNKKKKKVVKK